MDWWNRLLSRFRCKLVRGSRFPNADLLSCLANLARRGFQPRCIVDVGANRAKWSRIASQVFPRCDYTLIEPQVEMEPRLKKFCAGHANRRYVLAGAGSTNGELPFTVYPNTVASTFTRSAQVAAELNLEQRLVPVVTIDHVVRTMIGTVPGIIKIDAEGFEQEVVKGAESALGKTEVFFLEGAFLRERGEPTDMANLIAFMAERDHLLYDFSWFGRRSGDGTLEQCEAVFVRRHGYLRSGVPDDPRIPAPKIFITDEAVLHPNDASTSQRRAA